jgi:dihydrofolate reductase
MVIGRETIGTVPAFSSSPCTVNVFLISHSIKRFQTELKEKMTFLSTEPKEALNYRSGHECSQVYVDGGRLIQSFLSDDCIDEVIITKVPVRIVDGMPLFGPLARPIRFDDMKSAVFADGLVKNHYVRKRG